MLCRYYAYLKILWQLSPVGDWKHSKTHLGPRRQQQRVEPACAKEVADDDSTGAMRCEHFYPINTAFGANGCGLCIEIAGKQEPSWLRTIVTQHQVEIELDQLRLAEMHFTEHYFCRRAGTNHFGLGNIEEEVLGDTCYVGSRRRWTE